VASPFPTAALDLWRSQRLEATLAVQIDLTDPGARTVRIAYASLSPDPAGGVHFDPALEDAGPIEWPGAFLQSTMPQGSFSFSVLDVQLAGQLAGETAGKLFAQYRWQGARVTAWILGGGLTWANRAQVFAGRIEGFRATLGRIEVDCLQRNDWNALIVPEFASASKYPRIPQKNIGAPIPILIGRGAGQGLRGVYARGLGTDRNLFDHGGGAIPTLKGVLVDTGRGGAAGAKARVLFASHAMASLGAGTAGTNFFARPGSGGDAPAVVNPAGGDIFNAATGSGMTIPDEAGTHWVPIFCTEVAAIANTADNPRSILDPADEVRFSKIEKTGGYYYLRGLLPDVTPLGQLLEVWVVCSYTSFASIGDIRIQFERTGVGNQLYTPAINSTKFESNQVTPAGGLYTSDWQFSKNTLAVVFQVPANAGNNGVKFYVRTLNLLVKYRPEQKFIRYGKEWVGFGAPSFLGPPSGVEVRGVGADRQILIETAITELEGDFYANGNGPADDGGGTYTGAAAALIERAPDIAHYLLRTYGAQSAGQIETGVGVHGSFADARAKLKTWNGRDMTHLLAVDSSQPVSDALEKLARESCSGVFISRFSDKLKWVPFERSPSVNYSLKIEPEHVLGPELLRVESMAGSKLLSNVRIAYLWDAFRAKFAGDCSATPGFSSAGYSWLGLRDQHLTVVTGENDKLDWHVPGPTAYTATLTAGDYDPWSFAKHIAAQMNATPEDCIVHYGPRVETGYNDRLDFNDGANKTAIIAQADYASMEALAVAVAAAMNAVSTNWTVVYSRTTKKFTIDRTVANKTILGPGASFATSIKGALGLLGLANIACPAVSEHEVEEERFVVCDMTANLFLDIETGANGLNAATPRGCWPLLGFDGTRDTEPPTANSTSAVADCPKGTRERTLAGVAAKYGARREMTLQAKTILDTDTAREVRNRYIDLGAEPRAVVSFRSLLVPDLELYQVIEFSSRFDSLVRYTEAGSDGSWAGKKFWVVDGRTHVRPNKWETEVVCVRA